MQILQLYVVSHVKTRQDPAGIPSVCLPVASVAPSVNINTTEATSVAPSMY
jgi:hypothetical protein